MAAFNNQTEDFPVGLHRWIFLDGSGCREAGQEWRLLSLHLPAPQPGAICCGDGQCIGKQKSPLYPALLVTCSTFETPSLPATVTPTARTGRTNSSATWSRSAQHCTALCCYLSQVASPHYDPGSPPRLVHRAGQGAPQYVASRTRSIVNC